MPDLPEIFVGEPLEIDGMIIDLTKKPPDDTPIQEYTLEDMSKE